MFVDWAFVYVYLFLFMYIGIHSFTVFHIIRLTNVAQPKSHRSSQDFSRSILSSFVIFLSLLYLQETLCVAIAIISHIVTEYGWFYNSCKKCSKKVLSDGSWFFCDKCKDSASSIVPRFVVYQVLSQFFLHYYFFFVIFLLYCWILDSRSKWKSWTIQVVLTLLFSIERYPNICNVVLLISWS